MTTYLTAEQVLYLHDRLIREIGGSHGVRDLSSLLSAVGRPQSSFEGQDLYPDIYSQTAALVESLVRNHPFVDGSKRTGAAAAGLFFTNQWIPSGVQSKGAGRDCGASCHRRAQGERISRLVARP